MAGAPIEDAFPNYNTKADDDGCFLTEDIKSGADLSLKVSS
jgi:hypothetical protein